MNIQPLGVYSQANYNNSKSTSFQAGLKSQVHFVDFSKEQFPKLNQFLKRYAGGGKKTEYIVGKGGDYLMVTERNVISNEISYHSVKNNGLPSDEQALIEKIKENHKAAKSAFNFGPSFNF